MRPPNAKRRNCMSGVIHPPPPTEAPHGPHVSPQMNTLLATPCDNRCTMAPGTGTPPAVSPLIACRRHLWEAGRGQRCFRTPFHRALPPRDTVYSSLKDIALQLNMLYHRPSPSMRTYLKSSFLMYSMMISLSGWICAHAETHSFMGCAHSEGDSCAS